jgi:flagellar assembly protein FliH
LVDVFEFDSLAPPATPPIDPANASEQLQAMAEQARIDGHAEGLAAGLAQAHAEAAGAMEALAAAEAQVRASLTEFTAEAERAAVSLAMEIARKVVAAELETRPELVLEVVSSALRRATERDRLVVEVSPQDFPLIRDAADDLAGRLGGIQRLEVVAERRVERGGCIVRTPEGEIDGRISEQMERLAEVFDEARRKPAADV